jgi:hypothetical protein
MSEVVLSEVIQLINVGGGENNSDFQSLSLVYATLLLIRDRFVRICIMLRRLGFLRKKRNINEL